MAKKPLPDLLTIQQAADYLGSSRQAVWSAIQKERLPVAARYGRTILLSRQILAEYKTTRRRGGPVPKRKPVKR
jgi:excisionase family DNA binding protein